MTDTTPEGHTGNRSGIRRWGRFALHYVEMIIAMFAGMFALGLLWSALGFDPSYDSDPGKPTC